jgi:hypothetical protein
MAIRWPAHLRAEAGSAAKPMREDGSSHRGARRGGPASARGGLMGPGAVRDTSHGKGLIRDPLEWDGSPITSLRGARPKPICALRSDRAATA